MSTQTLAYGNIVNTNTLYPSALLLILGIGTCVFTMFPCASEPGRAFARRVPEQTVRRSWWLNKGLDVKELEFTSVNIAEKDSQLWA